VCLSSQREKEFLTQPTKLVSLYQNNNKVLMERDYFLSVWARLIIWERKMYTNKIRMLLGCLSLFGFLTAITFDAIAAPKKPGGYPSRPITIIMCYGKSGGSAQAIMAMKGPMSKIMGVKVNMISKPGGGGTNCLPDYQQTPADGYTLLMHTDGLITKYVGGVHDIHPTKDLTPLVIMNVAPTGMYIKGGDKRFMTNGKPDWDKVVKHAKQGDGKLSVSNLNSEMELITQIKVEKHFGFKTKQVLFNKPAQRYGAVIGGKLDVLVEQPGDVSKHVAAGTLAPVLSIWPERFKVAPDAKSTHADYGMKWDPLLRVRGFFIKKETPPEIISYLAQVMAEAYRTDEHQAFLKRKSLDIVDSFRSAADAKKIFDASIGEYAKIYKEMGRKVRPGL
jgi:tripartite-type tricarboxylate transporter receptor subunit TctC